jgi:hypothetical protein
MHPAISSFLDEVREAGKVRGLLTEGHVETIRSALENAHDGAAERGDVLDLWDGVRDVIADRSLSVKERLIEMGKVAERWDEKRRGCSH